MASNQSKLKRCFPLLLALVVLISCLPVIPVVADEIYWLDGFWEFSSDISWPSDLDFFYPSSVIIDGTYFFAFNFIASEDQIWLYNQGEDVCVYDSGDWAGRLPVVTFSEPVQVTKDEYDFFQANLSRYGSSSVTYTTTVNIDGELFNFFGTGSSPLVNMTVNIDGCTLTDGSSSRQFVYSGSGTFKGFSSSSGGSLNYSIGSTWTFGGKSGVDSTYSLFSVVDDDSQPVYSSSITINGVTETFSSTGSAPEISMQVLDTGAVFTAAGKSVPYVYGGEGSFLGFAATASSEPVFTPGNTYTLAAGDHIFYSVGDGSFTTTITIDGQKFIFTSSTEKPAVLLQVTSSGAILSYGDQILTFTYEGDGIFLGLAYSSLMDPSYLPGESYPLAAGSHTLKSVNDGTGTGSGPFETTIVIDGSVFQFFSDTEYPLVTCYLSSNGVRLVCGDDVRMWRPKYNEEFLGLSLSPNSSEPSYKLSDEWFMVRGSSTQYAFEYYSYCVESEENELARIFKSLATTILVPVSAFFTAEFIPGLPIGSVMLISFVVGLLFFFLKSSK